MATPYQPDPGGMNAGGQVGWQHFTGFEFEVLDMQGMSYQLRQRVFAGFESLGNEDNQSIRFVLTSA